MAETILRMTGIQKYFPGVHALDNAQLEVREGEVMALVGENGAGKSTLMKVLTGIYPSDGGTIEFFGKHVEIHGPRDAQALGICIVHQELNLMQHLTVAENIYIGREPMKGPFVDKAKQNAMTQELFDKLHLELDPKAVVKTLSVAKQQMVEITKALSHENTRLLILDEPSAVLTDTEIDDLFVFIRQLKKTGVGIIYISHRMDELKRITDRITVMRDGQYVATLETPTAEISEVIRLMVGRTIYEEPKTKSMCPPDAPVVLEAEHLNSLDVKDVSFKLRKGEILGFAGLVGAGRTETMRLICGADPMDSGTIRINGKDVKIRSPKDAVRYGIGYLSEDRKRYGLCLNLSVADNTVLPSLEQIFKGPFVHDKKGAAACAGARRTDPHENAVCPRPRRQPLRRQPAEGRHFQMDPARLRRADLRRADARHRRRRKERNLQAHDAACRGRQVHHHDLLRYAGAAPPVRPRDRHVRGSRHR